VYSATLGVIKAASAVSDPSDGRALVAAMKATPMQDPLYGPVTIREDGRKMQDVYLFQTKTPAESHGDWDFYKILSTIPAEQAFRPLAEGHCPMVKS
jgi:branched-chain amino acid transport system substrate-binding protein